MEFTIHSIGDAGFLATILRSVSMITRDGGFEQIIAIGLLFSVLFVCIQSLMQGATKIEFQQILVGWILYSCLFGPSATVLIEDSYSIKVEVVENVPLGPAVAGGFISKIGYGITQLFEQGYAHIAPTMTTSRFADSLEILNRVRRDTYYSPIFSAMNASAGGGFVDVKQSLENYIRECSLYKIDLGLTSLDTMMNANINEAIPFQSNTLVTLLHLSPGNQDGEILSCSEGWKRLSTILDSSLKSTQVIGVMRGLTSLDPLAGNTGLEDPMVSIGDALNSMGKSNTNALDYLKVAILEPVYFAAAEGHYKDFQDFNSSLMINQAIQQRNTQWAAEQTLFMTTVRPFLTFFEGFVYAITPILAFILVLGKPGISLAGKYCQVIIWIQLWLPVLSIVNLYIHSAASGQLQAMTGNDPLTSMYIVNKSSNIIQTWIATGGMLAAATPIISLFILTGSTYAFTSLAGRMSGGDSINEKAVVPDAVNQGPLLNVGAGYNHTIGSGITQGGIESILGGFSYQSGISATQTSASQSLLASSNTFGKTLMEGATSSSNINETRNRVESVGQNMASIDSKASQAAMERAKQFNEQFGISNDHINTTAGALQAYATGDIGTNGLMEILAPFSASFGAKASTTDQTSNSEKKTASDVSSYMEGVKISESESQTLNKQLAASLNDSKGENYTKTWGSGNSESISNAAQQVVSDQETLNKADAYQRSMGTTFNGQFNTLAEQVGGNKDATQTLREGMQLSNASVKAEQADLYSQFRNGYDMDSDKAYALSSMIAMSNGANYGGNTDNALNGLSTVTSAIEKATGRNLGIDSDPSRNKDIEDKADKTKNPSLQRDAENIAGVDLPGGKEGFTNTVDRKVNGDPDTSVYSEPLVGEKNVKSDHDAGTKSVQKTADSYNGKVSSPEVNAAKREIARAADESIHNLGVGTLIEGMKDNLFDGTARLGSLFAGGSAANIEASQKAMDEQYNLAHSMSPQDRQDFVDRYNSGDPSALDRVNNTLTYPMALGINAVDNLMNGDGRNADIKDLSSEEKGAFYMAAMKYADQEGSAATREFFNAYGSQMQADLTTEFKDNYELSTGQASVMAAAFSNYTGPTQDYMAPSIRALEMEYVERDTETNEPIMKDGNPVLSPENREHVDNQVEVLTRAAYAGDQAGSVIAPIRQYNTSKENI